MVSSQHEAFSLSTLSDGLVSGPLRFPSNLQSDQSGSIHDDATARHFGMPGAPIAGIYHMDLFPPMMTALAGDAWWRHGSLSLYFRMPTVEGEGVRGCAQIPPGQSEIANTRIQVRVDNESGQVVAEGTAASGRPEVHSMLREKIAGTPQPQDIRILDSLYVGKHVEAPAHHFDPAEYRRLIGHIVEPLPDYTPASPWPGQILAPSMIADIAYYGRTHLLVDTMIGNGGRQLVALLGGLDLQFLNGPMFLGQRYDLELEVLSVGESPKTEYFYYQCRMLDQASGDRIADFLTMMRFMKASSSQWQ